MKSCNNLTRGGTALTVTLSLSHQCRLALHKYLPDLRESRLVNLALLRVSIHRAQHGQLPKLAPQLPRQGQQESRVQRLRRFLSNAALAVWRLHAPFAVSLLASGAG